MLKTLNGSVSHKTYKNSLLEARDTQINYVTVYYKKLSITDKDRQIKENLREANKSRSKHTP